MNFGETLGVLGCFVGLGLYAYDHYGSNNKEPTVMTGFGILLILVGLLMFGLGRMLKSPPRRD